MPPVSPCGQQPPNATARGGHWVESLDQLGGLACFPVLFITRTLRMHLHNMYVCGYLYYFIFIFIYIYIIYIHIANCSLFIEYVCSLHTSPSLLVFTPTHRPCVLAYSHASPSSQVFLVLDPPKLIAHNCA